MNQEVDVTGIPETMLWTLHNRANESMRSKPLIKDVLCEKIYHQIDYNYERNFGAPDASHGFRSWAFDKEIKKWLQQNPSGIVIELGAGLETQFYRINPEHTHWYVVDVPEAIELRQRFIPSHPQLHNIAKSALDFTWMEQVPGAHDGHAFISFQGLLMYFEENEVQRLIQAVYEKYPNATIMFDTIPTWLSLKTLEGWKKTDHYTTPPMPWGINTDQIPSQMNQWIQHPIDISLIHYRMRGIIGTIFNTLTRTPFLKKFVPTITLIQPKK